MTPEDLGISEWVSGWNTRKLVVAIPITTPIQILGANPMRWGIMFPTHTTGNYNVYPDPAVTTQMGFQITISQPSRVYHYDEFGGVVMFPWYGVATGAPITVSILELLYIP